MFELPEDITSLDDAALDALLTQVRDALRALGLNQDSSDEDIAEAERLINATSEIDALRASRESQRAERTSRVNDLLARIPAAPEDAPSTEPEPVAQADAVAPPPQSEDTVTTPVPEPVAASASQSPAARAAQNAPEPVVAPARRAFSLTAAADVAGFSAGQALDSLDQAAAAIVSRLRSLPSGMAPSPVRQRFGAAVIQREFALVQDREYDDFSLLERAADERALPGGSLVAAGGWCSPSETVYDMCQLETATGGIDLPSVGISRGGLRYTPGPDFSAIYGASCYFHQTEAQAIAGDCKTCCTVTCPSFTDVRLEAVGYCVKVPILTNAAYPELVRRFIEGALVAHYHKVNAWTISQMATAAGATVTIAGAASADAASYALDALELQAIGLRYQYRLADNATIEMVAPSWYRHFIRMDVGRRLNQPWNSVTNEQIDANFRMRNISVQWVYDYQDLVVGANNAVTLPANAEVLMYPAGTWVKGGGDIISLDAVYDTVGLESNTYTGTFTEESILVVQRCSRTVKVTVPAAITGNTAAADITAAIVAGTVA